MKKNKPSARVLFGVAALLMTLSCRAKEPSVDRFKGEIGNFEKGQAFEKFISNHELKKVYIDARLTPDPMDDENALRIINDTFGVESFVVWDSCESLKAGEKPSIGNCTGTEFLLDRSEGPKDSDLTFNRGVLSLKGYFVVKGCDGPHQGLMGCTLRPLNVEAGG
jgi:hypothetical protein